MIMPVRDLLDEAIGDMSSDYNDGDNPGYYRYEWDENEQVLTIIYEPDDSLDLPEELRPVFAPTTARFRLVAVARS